jgi:preprotein translocase subunit SecF
MDKFFSKKIVILGLSLLILAGVVVVLFKGFNVNFLLEQHEVIEFVIGKDFDMKDVKDICKEVFGDKKVVLKTIEVFDDAVSINVESITNEEKENLVNKLNEKYETTKSVDDVTIETVSNVRIRDWLKPYIQPISISAVIILAYIAAKFREENLAKLLAKIIGIVLVTVLALLSVLAIFRVPMSPIYIMGLTAVALIELMIYINTYEKKEEKQK